MSVAAPALSRRAFALLPLLACARGPTRPVVAPSIPPSAIWMKRAVDRARDVVVTADLRALFADDSFAPAARRAMRAAADRAVPGAHLDEAWGGARAALVALPSDGPLLLVLAGVPDLDPTGLTGVDGAWQWRRAASEPPGTLELAFLPEAGSLFVLEDRTWVLGAGTAAQRARAALAEAGGHPVLALETERPVRLDVPAARFGHVLRRARVRELAPVFEGLASFSAEASVGAGASVFALLRYEDEASAARASGAVAELMRALAARPGEPLAFLAAGRAVRDGADVRVSAPLGADVLDALARSEDRLF